MNKKNADKLEGRVRQAIMEALADHNYVSSIDVFLRMGRLQQNHLDAWRKGQILYLERVIQGNLNKISVTMKSFRKIARELNLRPSESVYLACTRGPRRELRFSASGHPGIEKAYRMHFISPKLSQRQ